MHLVRHLVGPQPLRLRAVARSTAAAETVARQAVLPGWPHGAAAQGRDIVTRPRAWRTSHDTMALHLHLPGWDYADAYEVTVPHGVTLPPAQDVARALLRPGRTGRFVLALRDAPARLLGLRPVLTEEPTLFPVLHASSALAVLGLDDHHLDFRILVAVCGPHVRCTPKRAPSWSTCLDNLVSAIPAVLPAATSAATGPGWVT